MSLKFISTRKIVTFLITYCFFTTKSIEASVITTIQTNIDYKYNLDQNLQKGVSFGQQPNLDQKNGETNSLNKYTFAENLDKTDNQTTTPDKVPEIIRIEPGVLPTCKTGEHFVWVDSIKRSGTCARDHYTQCSDYDVDLGICRYCFRRHTLRQNSMYENYCFREPMTDFWSWFWSFLITIYITFAALACCIYCAFKNQT